MERAEVYKMGALSCSVCAPKDMPIETVLQQVNEDHPAGTDLGWTKADDEFFSDGETPNGGVVECHNGTTRHWLLYV